MVDVERSDPIAGETVAPCEGAEPAVLQAQESLATHAHPEPSLVVLAQGQDRVLGQLRRVALVEDRKADAVETNQAFLGSEPEIAVARLADGLDGVLRQPLLGLPDVLYVLGQSLGGIEAEDRRSPEQHQRSGDGSPAPKTSRCDPRHRIGRVTLLTVLVRDTMLAFP